MERSNFAMPMNVDLRNSVRRLIGPLIFNVYIQYWLRIIISDRPGGYSFTNLTLPPVIFLSLSRSLHSLHTIQLQNRPGKTDGQSPPTGKANPNSENGPTPPENSTPMHPTRASKPPRTHDSTDSAPQWPRHSILPTRRISSFNTR